MEPPNCHFLVLLAVTLQFDGSEADFESNCQNSYLKGLQTSSNLRKSTFQPKLTLGTWFEPIRNCFNIFSEYWPCIGPSVCPRLLPKYPFSLKKIRFSGPFKVVLEIPELGSILAEKSIYACFSSFRLHVSAQNGTSKSPFPGFIGSYFTIWWLRGWFRE